MKRLIASLLAISVAACIPTGCNTTDNTPVSSSVTTAEETSTAASTTETTATGPTTPTGPRYVLEDVDDSMTFDDTSIEYDGIPWAEQHDLTFVTDDIETDFARFMLDRNDNEYDNSPYHTVETITRPTVRTYPSDRDGYVVYEVNYTITIPIDVAVNGDYLHSYDLYHSVRFVDYYTGYRYPEIRMTNDTQSFCVSGNVIYNGETYFVEFYQFNDTTYPEHSASIGNNYSEWHQITQMDITTFFIVPRGYDGMLMYVDVSDINYTYEEARALGSVFSSDILGEGEDEDYLDKFEFIALAQFV